MTDAKHSPTPWRTGESETRYIYDAAGHGVASVYGYDDNAQADADAALIVRAVNAYDQETIQLLYEALQAAEWLEPKVWGVRTLAGCPVCLNGKPIHEPDCIVRAALARVMESQA